MSAHKELPGTKGSPAQQEILDAGLLTSGFNCILQMPTGSGKTWLAEQAIADTLARDQRAIYLAPLRALAEELSSRWKSQFSQSVGIFTGDYANSKYPISYADARVLIMTPERLDGCTRNWRSHWNWLPQVDLVVVDELHLLGDGKRGARLEGMLLRLLRLNPFLRILGLSATLGNRGELADWLKGIEYSSSTRPVPLKWKTVHFKKASTKPDLLIKEIQRNLGAGGKSLVFTQSRKGAEQLAKLLTEAKFKATFHHAGLDRGTRKRIETAFRNDQIDILIATSSLEMGLNFPVRQVVLYDLQQFNGNEFVPLPVNNVWQRAGRAGRPGMDKAGEVVLLSPSWGQDKVQYEKGKFEPILSGLSSAIALSEQIIIEVGSGYCHTINQLESTFSHSLAARQNRLPKIASLVEQMIEAGMLFEKEVNGNRRLQATRLGFIAVRHLISPRTVLLLQKVLQAHTELTFFDLLLVAVSCEDHQPIIRVDLEQLTELDEALSTEPSVLLTLPRKTLRELLGIDGKNLLGAINTALIARSWTRYGNKDEVAIARKCYPFEITCVQESLLRLLTAMAAILPADAEPVANNIPLQEKIHALLKMIATGLDEQAVTLALIDGIGPKTIQRLKEYGISDVEDLSLADPTTLIPRISELRLNKWIEQASDLIDKQYSAYRYREESSSIARCSTFSVNIDPYRIRRATELTVQPLSPQAYQVTGGLEPHLVTHNNAWGCDCLDFSKGQTCKHILAVRLYQGDTELQQLVSKMQHPENAPVNLLQLWSSSATITISQHYR